MSETLARQPMDSPDDDPDGTYLRLSAQRALWGAVGPHVDEIYVGYAGTTVRFVATVDAGLPDDERDALSGAAGEIMGDYPDGWTLDESIIVAREHREGWLVYQRYRREVYDDASGDIAEH